MKSYLDLITISAKVHRRQNRMTVLCIVFAVFLVTGVFSMAEMGIRMESTRLVEKHGLQALSELAASSAIQSYYAIAAVLFVLILLAGALMISGSINSNVAQRTKFFGMMRCIGMSKRQVVRFVRLEALNWCKTAIPIGLASGIVCTWALCAVLRFLVGEEFTTIPLFGVSLIGLFSGILLGLVTVLLAAGAPARRASRVSPVAAVSGNTAISANINLARNTRLFKIETSLGIRHALMQKKNLVLMTGSFALSIILFLSFSVFVELVNHMMPQSANIPDLSISCASGDNSIDSALPDRLAGMEGVKRTFGRRNLLDVPAEAEKDGYPIQTVDLISYDDFDLNCLEKDKSLKKGGNVSAVYGNSRSALLIADSDVPFVPGDCILVGDEELIIAGALKFNPFSADGSADGKITLIVSGETFTRLTGIRDYSLVLVQTSKSFTDENVEAIRLALDDGSVLNDMREQRTTNTYLAFVVCLYGFLAVTALITALNIMNSISMSVSARTKQYGAMRALGMKARQMTKMIAAEAFTYAIAGCIVGCVIGLTVSRLLYGFLITSHYSYAVWTVPVVLLAVIVLFVLAATFAAICAPVKRIRKMSVTDAINEL